MTFSTSDPDPARSPAEPFACLSPDERRVLELALAGIPNKLIAQRLAVSVRTVERHRATALRRLGVDTLVEAAGLRNAPQSEPTTTFDAALALAAPAGLVDAQGRFVAVNARYCRTLGLSEQELLGLDYTSVTHPADRQAVTVPVRRLFAGEIDSYTVEQRTVTATGLLRVTLALSTIWGRDGEPRFVLGQVIKAEPAA